MRYRGCVPRIGGKEHKRRVSLCPWLTADNKPEISAGPIAPQEQSCTKAGTANLCITSVRNRSPAATAASSASRIRGKDGLGRGGIRSWLSTLMRSGRWRAKAWTDSLAQPLMHPSIYPSGNPPCWHCEHFGERTLGWGWVWCKRDRRMQATPATGCVFWKRAEEPGVDDDLGVDRYVEPITVSLPSGSRTGNVLPLAQQLP